jgi:serine/threonine-protein kinase
MPLEIGTRLGQYEVVAAIGSGGMGEVYRARDTKLGREVAAKVLPEAFLHDTDRIARFEREAKALAALNHPHIAALYEMAQDGGRQFLVMELIEGITLRDLIGSGTLTLEQTLDIARQIADALEAAHEKGVVHRDLKPANVKITPDGVVKVLDFGLARIAASAPDGPNGENLTHSPTLSMMATQAGVILGTAAYMSPEQAKGFATDHRGDVFSFGSLLYEMLTGRQAFPGETAPDVLASIVAREADLSALPPNLNPRLVDLLRRCLEKNPKRRWQAVGDLRAEIETIAAAPRAVATLAPAAADQRPLRKRLAPLLVTAVITAVVAGAIGGGAAWTLWPAIQAPPVTRFRFTLPEGQQFQAPAFPVVALSPDGTKMVYAANQTLYLRSMSEMTPRLIAGTETPKGFTGGPFFSPDGKSVAFWSGMDPETITLKRVDVEGGVAVTVCQTPLAFGGSWGTDGIVFSSSKGVMRVSPDGGQPELLVGVKSGEGVLSPQMLPGGKAILFTLVTDLTAAQTTPNAERWDKAQIVVHTLTTGTRKTLIDGGSDARYLPSGHIVYAVGGVLFAVPFDLQREAVTGARVPVVEGVQRGAFVGVESGVAQFSVSDSGSLVYAPTPARVVTARRNLVIIDRKGNVEPLKLPPLPYEGPRISPDGKQLVYGTDDGRAANIWIYALGGTSAPRQLTFSGKNHFPIWTPDGQRVSFQSDREGDAAVFWQRADGTTAAERVTRPETGVAHIPRSWSPDARTLLIGVTKNFTKSLLIFSLQDQKAVPLVGEQDSVASPHGMFSPDGRWVAYSDGAAFQLLVQPVPSTGAQYLIASGGRHPLWSPDGKGLYFSQLPLERGALRLVSVATQPTFALGNPVPQPSGPLRGGLDVLERQFDITPDGTRFIAVVDATENQDDAPVTPQLHVVLNWFDELKQRVPGPTR